MLVFYFGWKYWNSDNEYFLSSATKTSFFFDKNGIDENTGEIKGKKVPFLQAQKLAYFKKVTEQKITLFLFLGEPIDCINKIGHGIHMQPGPFRQV